MKRRFLTLAALFAVTACGGGGGTNVVPQTTPTAGNGASGASDAAVFSIVIPAASGSATAHARAAYVSPATGSIAFTLASVNGVASTGQSPIVIAIGAHAAGCAAAATGTTCTVSVPAPAGTDVFAVATYQSSNGTGPVLAATTIAATSGTNSAPVALDLGGVPSSVIFSPARLPLVDDGSVQKTVVTVNAADASGAVIVGNAPFASPIDLQVENDPGGALGLSTASVQTPGTVVTVTYDSTKALVDASIVARDNGMTAATLVAAPLVVSPLPVTVLDDASSLAVSLTESGFGGTFTASLANANDATLAMTQGTPGSGSAVATIVPKTHFDVTTLNVGDGTSTFQVPVQILPDLSSYTAYGPAHTLQVPTNTIRASNGVLWTGDAQNGNLVAFDPSTGSYTTHNVDPTDQGPYAIAFDGSGNIWFADGPQIGEFNPSTSAVTTYATGLQASAWVTTIVAGPSGTMWFYDQGNATSNLDATTTAFGSIATASGSIVEYPTSNGVGPVNAALGSTLATDLSMALASDGSIWFADAANDAIGHLNTTSGSITETKLGTPSYPEQSPQQVLIAQNGKIWFASYSASSNTATIGTLDPSSGTVTYNALTSNQGQFTAATIDANGDVWFALTPMLGTFHSAQQYIGVANPSTGAAYVYPSAILPQSAIAASFVDASGTLWILDNAFGEIGKVSIK